MASRWGVEDLVVAAILSHHAPQSEAAHQLAFADWIADNSSVRDALPVPPPYDIDPDELAALCETVRERFRAEAERFE